MRRKREATTPADRELRARAIERIAGTRDALPEVGPEPSLPQSELPPPLGTAAPEGGRPLAPGTRKRMEQVFGEDLGDVRVHDDEAARQGAKRVGAKAYAVGRDVYFGPSRTPDGDDALLAHELTHVLQDAGDGSTATPARERELEDEAEASARAVHLGERPEPIAKRPGSGGLHRAGEATDAMAHQRLTRPLWDRIRNDPQLANNAAMRDAIAALKREEEIGQEAKGKVYDAEAHMFRNRAFVPMRFPGPRYLSHRSVTGDIQIVQGEFLERSGETRADSNQNRLSRIMYDRPAVPAGVTDWFTRSARGTVTFPSQTQACDSYRTNPHYVAALAAGELLGRRVWVGGEEPATSASVANLSLDQTGFNELWATHVYIYSPQGGEWRRWPPGAAPAAAAAPAPAAGAGAPADPALAATTVDAMVADYESHHVIPLWLRSGSGKPAGDQLPNLVPWHREAHQTNHGFHHRVPDDVLAATGVADYREFLAGTRFLLYQVEGGTREHPAGAPPVTLDLATNTWVRREGGPPWLSSS